jgi:predicted O-linked N-acetylglucosamine transferase (SPINDLY family)
MVQATQHHRAGELEAAKSRYLEILKQSPAHADALHLFGLACHQQGDHQTAAHYIRQAVELVPDQPVLRNNLGDALRKSGDLAGAILHLRQALALRAEYAGAHQNLGSVLAETGDHEAALFHSREAARLAAESPEAWFNLGLLLLDHVRLEESIQSFRKALSLRPVYRAAANSLLYVLNLVPNIDPQDVAAEHGRVAAALFDAVPMATQWPAPTRRIRIGYVSGDFRAHAVSYFFEPLLEHHDDDRFETFCYSDVTKPDPVTLRLQALATHWQDIAGWTDAAVSERIRSDGIDILVDLSGYTEHGRLGVFAGKAARCQISYLGYPNTTGLAAMDFRIVDGHTAPANAPAGGSERLLRVADGFACFRPPAHAMVIPPARAGGGESLTFGSLHKLEKLNGAVIETWSRILLANPGSRLLIARDQLDSWHQQRLLQAFGSHGVGSDRLDMVRLSDPTQSFFEIFPRMDILLDVFPWSGHTIACCALWMGVPVVTLRGNTHAGRMVASVLESLDLRELVAADTQNYVRIVGELCRDRQRLAEVRSGLRQRVERSPLRDEAGFARKFEAACLSAFEETLRRP